MYFVKKMLQQSRKLTKKWEEEVQKSLQSTPDQKAHFSTVSDLEIKRLYTPEDIEDTNFAEDIAAPGEYPTVSQTKIAVRAHRNDIYIFPLVFMH
jgi:methylmalonyl-CoA mutase N-terminal domain/subunit